MKTLKKRILKPLLFVCLGLSIAIITFASDLPSPPGRPSPFDIEADRCKLRFKEPIRSGASRIQRYRIEYQSEKREDGYSKEQLVLNFPLMVLCNLI